MTKKKHHIKDIDGKPFEYGYKEFMMDADLNSSGKPRREALFYIDGKLEQVTMSISPERLRTMAKNMIAMADAVEKTSKARAH